MFFIIKKGNVTKYCHKSYFAGTHISNMYVLIFRFEEFLMKQIKTYLNRLTTTNNTIIAQLFLYINTIYIFLILIFEL